MCPHREMTTAWNHRACVLYTGINRGERDARRRLVAALMEQESNKPA